MSVHSVIFRTLNHSDFEEVGNTPSFKFTPGSIQPCFQSHSKEPNSKQGRVSGRVLFYIFYFLVGKTACAFGE